MKKLGYMIIGAIFTLVLSIGFLSFADSSGVTDSDNAIIDSTVDLQNELMLKETNELREDRVHVVKETPVLVATGDTIVTKTIENEGDSSVKEDLILATEEPFFAQLEKFEVNIESDQTEIKLKQERKKKKVKSEVEIEWKNEKVKLKDQRADDFIEELFSEVHIVDTQDLSLMAEQLLEEFQMNPHAVEIEINAEKLDGTTYKFEIDN